jgi:hypothetical protein
MMEEQQTQEQDLIELVAVVVLALLELMVVLPLEMVEQD